MVLTAMVAKEGLDWLTGGSLETFKKRSKIFGSVAVGSVILLGSAVSGVEYMTAQVLEAKKAATLDAGKQTVTEINTNLNEWCSTSYQASYASSARLDETFAGIDFWRQQKVNGAAEVKFCMDAGAVTGQYDANTHKGTLHIDTSRLYTDVRAITSSETIAPRESSPNYNAERMAIEAGLIVRLPAAIDADTADTAFTSDSVAFARSAGKKAVVTNCAAPVLNLIEKPLSNNIVSSVIQGARIVGTNVTANPEDFTVLFGDASTPHDNVQQITKNLRTSEDQSYDDTIAKLNKTKNVTVQGSTGDCTIPANVASSVVSGGK